MHQSSPTQRTHPVLLAFRFSPHVHTAPSFYPVPHPTRAAEYLSFPFLPFSLPSSLLSTSPALPAPFSKVLRAERTLYLLADVRRPYTPRAALYISHAYPLYLYSTCILYPSRHSCGHARRDWQRRERELDNVPPIGACVESYLFDDGGWFSGEGGEARRGRGGRGRWDGCTRTVVSR